MVKFERKASTFQVVVSETMDGEGDYKIGQQLTNPMDIAKYFRSMCALGDVVLTMDDNQIIAIVKSVPFIVTEGSNPETEGSLDWDTEACATLESRNKPNDRSPRDVLPDTRSITDVRIASGSVASLIGEKFDANENFRNVLHTAVHSTEVVKVSPIRLLLSTFDIYGLNVDNEGNVKDLEKSNMFNEIPHPKSAVTKETEYWKRNGKVLKEDENNFAEYPKLVGKDLVKYDWYAEMFAATKEGKYIEENIKQWTLAREGKGKIPSGPYADKLQDEVFNKQALWKLRWSTGVKFLKMAIEACYQWRDIQDQFHGKISVQLGMDGHGTDKAQVSEGFTTIIIYEVKPGSRALSQALTVSGFNNLDIDKAIEKGGAFSHLRDSSKSGVHNTDESGLWDEGEIKIAGVLDNLPQLADWFAIPANLGDLMAKADAKDKATRERTEDAENTILAGMKWYHAMSRFATRFAGIANDIEDARAAEKRAMTEKVKEKIKSAAA